jgi:hypothetical protein
MSLNAFFLQSLGFRKAGSMLLYRSVPAMRYNLFQTHKVLKTLWV